MSPARVVRRSADPSATAPSSEHAVTTSGLWLLQESTGTDRRQANPPVRRAAQGGSALVQLLEHVGEVRDVLGRRGRDGHRLVVVEEGSLTRPSPGAVPLRR
ncbi:predicted protein [Streptomyces viridochromogenes DSM 40736]|uniref:Predicted protein n=1 Tax=Streptomyces viridochromogenes (strain DSM 40736 / JCM 4977 / BCRC 1201 / Tue 494) TaxID=591159 RepID=D9X8I5_STRVT|nr:predicted protein [Streptomyces viridochromogenes DSM 40736]